MAAAPNVFRTVVTVPGTSARPVPDSGLTPQITLRKNPDAQFAVFLIEPPAAGPTTAPINLAVLGKPAISGGTIATAWEMVPPLLPDGQTATSLGIFGTGETFLMFAVPFGGYEEIGVEFGMLAATEDVRVSTASLKYNQPDAYLAVLAKFAQAGGFQTDQVRNGTAMLSSVSVGAEAANRITITYDFIDAFFTAPAVMGPFRVVIVHAATDIPVNANQFDIAVPGGVGTLLSGGVSGSGNGNTALVETDASGDLQVRVETTQTGAFDVLLYSESTDAAPGAVFGVDGKLAVGRLSSTEITFA